MAPPPSLARLWAAIAAAAATSAAGQRIDPKGVQVESSAFKVQVDGKEHKMGIVLDANYRWLYDGHRRSCGAPDAKPSEAEACFLQGLDKDQYEDTYGISVGQTDPTEVTLRYAASGKHAAAPNYGSRAFVADLGAGDGYSVFKLLGKEISFTLDLSNVPAGMNAAVYLVGMDPTGGLGTTYPSGEKNGAGWKRGMGYCDAQCPKDTKFAQEAGWNGEQKVLSCCPEMDLFEGNRLAAAMTAHPCKSDSRSTCDPRGNETCENPCDTEGADVNLFRRFGPDYALFELIDPKKPVTLRTQFHVDENGTLKSVVQLWEQRRPDGSRANFSMVLTDEAMSEQKALFHQADTFKDIGGLAQMGAAMEHGMVLALAIWSDPSDNMRWLDSCHANETQFDCQVNSSFNSPEVWHEAVARGGAGAWRGPVDALPSFDASFASKEVKLSYPRIPKWMASQPKFECAKRQTLQGAKFDCSTVPYRFSVRDLRVSTIGAAESEPTANASAPDAAAGTSPRPTRTPRPHARPPAEAPPPPAPASPEPAPEQPTTRDMPFWVIPVAIGGAFLTLLVGSCVLMMCCSGSGSDPAREVPIRARRRTRGLAAPSSAAPAGAPAAATPAGVAATHGSSRNALREDAV